MGVRSGRKVSRSKVETYRGFDIIKVKVVNYHKNLWGAGYDSNWIEHREVYFDFCKEGNDKRPSQAYECNANTIASCRDCIDNFIKDDSLYFTSEERDKYVYKPNHKCHWAYGYNSLMKIMRDHKKADKRIKILLEDRLTDANFHGESGLLSKGDYEGFAKFVKEHYPFREKFEIITLTPSRRIKDPKRFEEGIAKAVEEYFASQGANDTKAEVSFVEDW